MNRYVYPGLFSLAAGASKTIDGIEDTDRLVLHSSVLAADGSSASVMVEWEGQPWFPAKTNGIYPLAKRVKKVTFTNKNAGTINVRPIFTDADVRLA